MKTVYLHIGTHKTGTTSLQWYLTEASDRLLEQGVLYPQTGRPARLPFAHHELAWSILQMPEAPGQDPWPRLVEEIRASPAERVVLSAEDFSLCDPEQIDRIARRLEEFRVEVVVYVRRIRHFVLSSYKQHLLSRGQKTLREFIPEIADRCDYLGLVERWAEAPGIDRVDVHAYDRVRREPGLITHFVRPLEGRKDALELEGEVRVNVSPSDDVLQTVRLLNVWENRIAGKKDDGITSRISYRLRRAAYNRNAVGRLLMRSVRPWRGANQIADELSEDDWQQLRTYLADRHARFLDRYIEPPDREYLRF